MRTATRDLTAPARIRNAAVRLYGEHGFDIGLRAIAEAADVSLGLIRHHFGSKDGLREACDDFVISEIRRLQDEQMAADDLPASAIESLAAAEEYRPMLMYVLHALRAGGAMARSLVDHAVEHTVVYLDRAEAKGEIRPSIDRPARARYLVMQKLGTLLLEFSLADDLDPMVTWRRWLDANTLPALELMTDGLFVDRSMFDTYLAHLEERP